MASLRAGVVAVLDLFIPISPPSQTPRIAAEFGLKRAEGQQRMDSALPPSPASLERQGISPQATVLEKETPEGPEIVVRWVDFALLLVPEKGDFHIFLVVMGGLAFVFGMGLGGGIGTLLIIVGIVLAGVMALAVMGMKHHERQRYSVRTVTFRPDGSIAFGNPPSEDANNESDGQPFAVASGLEELVSIEYGKTADWKPLDPQHVPTVNNWYDVYMLFGADRRISVSRNCGSREHAHQVAGQLNEVRARLTSRRPQVTDQAAQAKRLRRPGANRIID